MTSAATCEKTSTKTPDQMEQARLERIAGNFKCDGAFVSGTAFGGGHINDTFLITCQGSRGTTQYILQRINTGIFKDPVKLMDNVVRITEHQYRKLMEREESEVERKCLRFVPTLDGKYFWADDRKNYWRVCRRIERAHTRDLFESEHQAFEAAAAFARFQKLLVDLPGGRLFETIPDFHNTVKRYSAFESAARMDIKKRADECRKDIAFAVNREKMAPVIVALMEGGSVPERVTHNDTKLNNIMLDDATGQAVCIIDLDTVMPGSSLYDFGDMVRSSASTASEDEKDPGRVAIDAAIFRALAGGYLSEAREFLTATEIDHLVFSGKLITFEQGIRFLTDYLNGDQYYKTKYPGHNLDRARNQFALVASIEAHEQELRAMVAAEAGKSGPSRLAQS
jgi:Ser/Thr protein kinase RdoA (MazF antagonist)